MMKYGVSNPSHSFQVIWMKFDIHDPYDMYIVMTSFVWVQTKGI